jgi:AbiV family abortive infection protein
MKVRRVSTLTELADAEFLVQVALGSGHCLRNAERLYSDAESALNSAAHRSHMILCGFAEEEASKALILVDAVRCPLSEQPRRLKQLAKFSHHLSRKIYSEVCSCHPGDFRELEGLVEELREEYFLDGPNGFDWIYRNRLLQDRESALYVDYVEDDDGRRWDIPNDALAKMLTTGGSIPPQSLSVARHLSNAGIFSAAGLKIVADVWRDFIPSGEVRWASLRTLNQQTVERLQAAGLCGAALERDLSAIRDDWPFPLWSLDTGLRKVSFESLGAARERLAARYPDGY